MLKKTLLGGIAHSRIVLLIAIVSGSAIVTPARALAADPVIAGNASIGSTSIGSIQNVAAFFRTGQLASTQYAIATDGTHTYINAPTASGNIYFRGQNGGPNGNRLIMTSTGFEANCNSGLGGCFDATTTLPGGYALEGVAAVDGGVGVRGFGGTGNTAGVYGQADFSGGTGVYGYSGGPANGVFGSSSSGVGVAGNSSSNNGLEGRSASTGASGVYGYNSSGSGYGVAGRILGTNNGIAVFGDNPSPNGFAGYFNGTVNVQGNITASGTITPGSSDGRLKKNVQPLTGALDSLLKLRGVTFEWKTPAEHGDQKGTQRGFIAQEVETVMPEWIGKDDKGFRTIAIPGRGLEALLVESIRVLNSRNEELRAHNEELGNRLSRLEARSGHTVSSSATGNLGVGVALGLLPLGLVVAIGKRRGRAERRS